MSDFRPILRPVLAAKTAISSAHVKLSALPEGAIVHVLGQPGEQDMASFLSGLDKGAVRNVSPGQWFIVGNEPMMHWDMKALLETLEPRATGIDQSGGRVRIRIEGSHAARVLSKGTAVDLSAGSFPIGQSATTLIGHIAVHLTRILQDDFELMVLRGFAESLWDDLIRMSAEYR
ncbi:sarcosine oxidase subunit gamma (plasmid) [Mesorhizobium sp. AR07]|uniref:sarcosine oxidase subunit gamma n=1 Tax=Mesorhizobium sp. AR07 TaxID=2865838 RepID=UPI00215F1F76|nr:sarcosine oxidase subunit gamma [Mesorhizobium sp. AR07]UVK48358.1 sarcosine oxidase subunit gamma [Mesorhizobium sp. AR07]